MASWQVLKEKTCFLSTSQKHSTLSITKYFLVNLTTMALEKILTTWLNLNWPQAICLHKWFWLKWNDSSTQCPQRLYLIYSDDLYLCILNCSTYHFADDTNFLCIGKTIKKIKKKVNFDLKRLVAWLLANKISLNKIKTELIFFRKPRDKVPDNYDFKLNGLKLRHSNYKKYVGIYQS